MALAEWSSIPGTVGSYLQTPPAAFLGTPICSRSLEELEEQVYKEQPWLRQDSASHLPPRMLLAAAARAVKIDARRAKEALTRAAKAAQAARASAEAKERQARDADDAAESLPNDASLAAAAVTARAAAKQGAAMAASAEDTARRCQQHAASIQQAALSFWEGGGDPGVDGSWEHQLRKREDRSGPERFRGSVNRGFDAMYDNTAGSAEGFTCSEFESSRTFRAAPRASRPEDFMDKEDMQQAAQRRRVHWPSRIQQQSGGGDAGADDSLVEETRSQLPSWTRVEGRGETLPVYLGAGEARFAFQPQWCMQSMRRSHWARHLLREHGSSGEGETPDLDQARQKTEGLLPLKGPHLPRHVEAVRQRLRPRCYRQQNALREPADGTIASTEGAWKCAEGSLPSADSEDGAVSAMLLAEACEYAAEEERGWAAAQRLLRLQPLGPNTFGLGFQELRTRDDSAATLPLATGTTANVEDGSSCNKTAESRIRRVEVVGDVLEVDVCPPRSGLRNYAIDDDEAEEELYTTTDPRSALYDFEGTTEAERADASKMGRRYIASIERRSERQRLLAEAAAEGVVVVSDDETVEGQQKELNGPTREIVPLWELIDDKEWALEAYCDLPVPPIPEDFDGTHLVAEAEEMKYRAGCGGGLADEMDTTQGIGSFQAAEKVMRGRGFSSGSLGLPRDVADTISSEVEHPEAAVPSAPLSLAQPLWASMTASSRAALVEQVGGRRVQWVREGDEEAVASAARQPVWLQQHQEQLLRRNQRQRIEQQIVLMRHRLNCLQLPFVADPETQSRFDAYKALRDAEAEKGAGSLNAEGVGPTGRTPLSSATAEGAAGRAAVGGEAAGVEAVPAVGEANEVSTPAVGTAQSSAILAAPGADATSASAGSSAPFIGDAGTYGGAGEAIEPSTCQQAVAPIGLFKPKPDAAAGLANALRAVAAINAGVSPAALVPQEQCRLPNRGTKGEEFRGLIECARTFQWVPSGLAGALVTCRGPAEAALFATAYGRIVEQRQLLRDQEEALKYMQQDSLARLGIMTQHNITQDFPSITPADKIQATEGGSLIHRNTVRQEAVEFRTMLPLLRSHRTSSLFVPSPYLCKLWDLPDPWANVAQIEMLRLLREQQAGPASECGGRVELPPEPTINLATPAAAACGRHQPSVNVVRPPDANHTADDAMATQDHEDYIEGHLLEVPNAVQTGLFKINENMLVGMIAIVDQAIFEVDENDEGGS